MCVGVFQKFWKLPELFWLQCNELRRRVVGRSVVNTNKRTYPRKLLSSSLWLFFVFFSPKLTSSIISPIRVTPLFLDSVVFCCNSSSRKVEKWKWVLRRVWCGKEEETWGFVVGYGDGIGEVAQKRQDGGSLTEPGLGRFMMVGGPTELTRIWNL